MFSVGVRRDRWYSRGVFSLAEYRDADVELRGRTVGSKGDRGDSSWACMRPMPGVKGLKFSGSAVCGPTGSEGTVSSSRQDKARTPVSRMTVPSAMRPACKALRRDACRKYIRPSKIATML